MKIFFYLSSALLFGLFSCSEKQRAAEPEPVEELPEVEVQKVIEYDEYSEPMDSIRFLIGLQTNSRLDLVDSRYFNVNKPAYLNYEYIIGNATTVEVETKKEDDIEKHEYHYNELGLLTKDYELQDDGSKKIVSVYQYDEVGRIISNIVGDVKTTYEYNAEGKVSKKVGNGVEHQLIYQGDTMIVESWIEQGNTIKRTVYLNKFNQVKRVVTQSNLGTLDAHLSFNELGFLKNQLVSRNGMRPDTIFSFEYDINGVVTEEKHRGTIYSYENEFGSDYGFIEFTKTSGPGEFTVWQFNQVGDWLSKKVFDDGEVIEEVSRIFNN